MFAVFSRLQAFMHTELSISLHAYLTCHDFVRAKSICQPDLIKDSAQQSVSLFFNGIIDDSCIGENKLKELLVICLFTTFVFNLIQIQSFRLQQVLPCKISMARLVDQLLYCNFQSNTRSEVRNSNRTLDFFCIIYLFYLRSCQGFPTLYNFRETR